MNRPWLTWTLFAAALALVLAAMGWISLTVLRLDAQQEDAQRQAALEESVRLALWRMESSLAPIIAQENARPYFAYNSFYPAERAYDRMFNGLAYGDVLIPSGLMTFSSPRIVIHFQLGPDGKLTSPQVPTGNTEKLALERYLVVDNARASAAKLEELKRELSPAVFAAAMPPAEPFSLQVALRNTNAATELEQTEQSIANPPPQQLDQQSKAQAKPAAQPSAKPSMDNNMYGQQGWAYNSPNQQAELNRSEVQSRQSKSVGSYSVKGGQRPVPEKPTAEPAPRVAEGVMTPVRVGSRLILARRVRINGGEYIQGCVLDWPAIREWLLSDVRDLLPAAQLELRAPGDNGGADPTRALASLPARLTPGPPAIASIVEPSPIKTSLAVAWGCIVLAAAAVALLLRGAMVLSERRGSFVSAVTHEMRTPLTTFRLYTEMLGEGRVKDDATRLQYLGTLRDEAERLSHMVDNVLAQARLERGRTRAPVEATTLGAILDRVTPRLSRRAERAGMELVVEATEEARATRAAADIISLEQILLNLVDNACKYASDATDRRLHLEAGAWGDAPFLRVRDHGPGIGRSQVKRLFKPFSKSAHEAANTKPGVGLGLALSRRLARAMGGGLAFDEKHQGGASFVLTLAR